MTTRAFRMLALALVLAPAASAALGTCVATDAAHVCSDGASETTAEESTPAGTVTVTSYTAEREGAWDGSYTATRDGARVALSGSPRDASADVQRADYRYVSGDTTVRQREVRVTAEGASHAVGFERTDFGPVVVCRVYADGVAVDTPCTSLHP